MPRGTRHTLTGTLRWTRFGYALEMDDGGVWRLDVGWGWKARRSLNLQVTVEGVRSGFDSLDVQSLKRGRSEGCTDPSI
jgi:Protein of unknown function (DUF5818)